MRKYLKTMMTMTKKIKKKRSNKKMMIEID